MTIATALPIPKPTPESNRLLFQGLTWREFKFIEQLLDQPGYRLSFLEGTLEIQQMPTARDEDNHETVKKRIAALLELYLLMAGFDFQPTGSMTLENEASNVKREADESYKLTPNSKRPDLAIEIVFSSGGIDKLEAYRRLKISEVWFWEDGVLELYHLSAGNLSNEKSEDGNSRDAFYEKITASKVVPGIDLELFCRCILISNHVESLKTFQAALLA